MPIEKKDKHRLIFHTILIIAAIVVFILLLRWLWEDVWSFNMKTVETYVTTAAAAYSLPDAAAIIINQQIKAILDEPEQIRAVKFAAIQNSVSNEQQLVNAALNIAITYGYL